MTSSPATPNDWQIFKGNNTEPHDDIQERLPPAPGWRPFGQEISPGVSRRKRRGKTFQTRPEEVKMVNAALYLRRPLLVTGNPGTGKSSLAYAVAEELNLGEVLYWPITTRTTLKAGLYNYDAIGRLQEVKEMEARGIAPSQPEDLQAQADKIANFITLGPLGTALLPSKRPRVLLIDEIDKSDIDLPNDLLTIFEEGRFEIPELLRLEKDDPDGEAVEPLSVRVRTAYTDQDEITRRDRKVTVPGGRVTCEEFPLVILTSNGERDFPPPFLRRCLRLNMYEPNREQLTAIVKKHFENEAGGCDVPQDKIDQWVGKFLEKRDKKEQLATDQLLNALHMVTHGREQVGDDIDEFIERFLLAPLDRPLATHPKTRSPQSPA